MVPDLCRQSGEAVKELRGSASVRGCLKSRGFTNRSTIRLNAIGSITRDVLDSAIVILATLGTFQTPSKGAYQKISSPYDIEILVALADGEGSGAWEEFMAEDFSDEDVLGHVYGFKAVAADSGVGASQVAWFPGKVQGAEVVGDVLRELGTGGRVDGIGARKAL